MIPDYSKPIGEFLDRGDAFQKNNLAQQNQEADMAMQLQRWLMQEQDKKRQEAIQAALATLKQTEQATPDMQNVLGNTPYAGMIQNGRLAVSPQEQAERAQKASDAKARAQQAEAYLKLTQGRGEQQQQTLQAPEVMSELTQQTSDPQQLIIEAVKRGAVKPDAALRMLSQIQQAKERMDFQKSKPQPGAIAAGNRSTADASQQALAEQRAELPAEIERAGGDREVVIQQLLKNRAALGMTGRDLNTLISEIRRGY